MKNYEKYWIFILISLLLAGCSTPLKIKLNSSAYLNPDEQNRSLPVQVVIYQLRDEQIFKQATFQELWQDDRDTLGSSLLNRREVNIIPGIKTTVALERDKEAQFIAVMAIFRDPQGGAWRAIKKIGKGMPLTSKHIVVMLHGNRIQFK